MEVDASLGFLFLGAALMLPENALARRSESLRQSLALMAVAISLIALAAYFLKLDLVYGWRGIARTAPQAAGSLGVLGIGLWMQAGRAGGEQLRQHGRDILLMVAASLAVRDDRRGGDGIRVHADRVEQMTTDSLVRLHSDRARLFTNIILQAHAPRRKHRGPARYRGAVCASWSERAAIRRHGPSSRISHAAICERDSRGWLSTGRAACWRRRELPWHSRK